MRSTVRMLAGAAALALLPMVASTAPAAARTAHCAATADSVKVEAGDSPMTVAVMDTRTGTLVDVVVTITGTTFTLTPLDPTVELVDAAWCVKSSTKTNDGTGTSGASASTNKHGQVQDISYLMLASVTTKNPIVVQPCNASTSSGGAGVTTTNHDLGNPGPANFSLDYETYNVPDRIQVTYEGVEVLDTGYVGDSINQGTGTALISLPAGTDSHVVVTVTGPSGTVWDYRVNCPATP